MEAAKTMTIRTPPTEPRRRQRPRSASARVLQSPMPVEEVSTDGCIITVNREYFDVKIFSDSMACTKIKRTKYIRNINDNAVQGRLSENYLT